MADRMGGSNMAHQPAYALVVAASRLLSKIPAMIKLKMTATNNSNQPQYLARLAQSAYEMSAIVIGDNCDDSITSSTADSHDCQKSPEAVVRSKCRPEKHACRKWKWYRCRSGESTGAPFVKKAENGIQLPISELAVQVGRSGPSCDSEREKGSDHRPYGRDCRILVPRIAVAGSENPSECRGRRMLAGESYRESRGRKAPVLPSGGTSR